MCCDLSLKVQVTDSIVKREKRLIAINLLTQHIERQQATIGCDNNLKRDSEKERERDRHTYLLCTCLYEHFLNLIQFDSHCHYTAVRGRWQL